jgi:hypothetical protein
MHVGRKVLMQVSFSRFIHICIWSEWGYGGRAKEDEDEDEEEQEEEEDLTEANDLCLIHDTSTAFERVRILLLCISPTLCVRKRTEVNGYIVAC